MKPALHVYVLPLIFAGIWGMTFVWSQRILQVYSPVTMIFIRLTLASLPLYGFAKLTKRLQKIERKDWRIMLVAVVCEPFLYFIGESYGIVYSSASFASIMIALIPLLTPIGAWLILGIRSNWAIVAGLLVSFAGVLYMILGDQLELTVNVRGVLFLVLAVLSAVFYTLCIQKLSAKYNNFTIVFYQSALGALMFFPFFVCLEWQEFWTIPFDLAIFGNFMLLAIFGSCIAYICFVESIKQLGAVRTFVFNNLIPIVTVIGAYFLLDERFTTQKIIGIGLVILGLFVSQIRWKS